MGFTNTSLSTAEGRLNLGEILEGACSFYEYLFVLPSSPELMLFASTTSSCFNSPVNPQTSHLGFSLHSSGSSSQHQSPGTPRC